MKEEKGITLIALVITIIIMLILVGATITILTQGDLINKAKGATIGTDELAKNETNRMNELGAEIENAAKINNANHTKTVFEFNKNYPELFINPNPEEIGAHEEEIWIECETFSFWIPPTRYTGTWENTGIIVATGTTAPENPSEGDLWNDISQYHTYVKEYRDGNWVDNTDIKATNNRDKDIEVRVGVKYFDYSDTNSCILYECTATQSYPELIYITLGETMYVYFYTQDDANFYSEQMGITIEQGWNSISENDEGFIAEHIEDNNLPKLLNCNFNSGEEYFNEFKEIMSNYISDTPW